MTLSAHVRLDSNSSIILRMSASSTSSSHWGRQGHVVLRCGRPSALAGSFASMMKEALLQNLAVPDDGVSCIDLAQRVEKSGFVVVPQCLQGAMKVRLSSYLNATTYAARNLLSVPIVRELAGSAPVRVLAETVLGKNCFAVK